MHSKHRRNAYWNNIVRKAGGFTVREVCRHEDEELVFLAEQERIDQLKRLGVKLSNMTDGGEGPSGYRHTEETKQLLSITNKGKNAGINNGMFGKTPWNKGLTKATDSRVAQYADSVSIFSKIYSPPSGGV
jgi:hypothetical protein